MKKRAFFAFDLTAPWPDAYPKGRLITPENRHLTLAFLGDVDPKALRSPPLPELTLGLVGKFDQCLFFPKHSPRVVAWNVSWLEPSDPFDAYVDTLATWLRARGLLPDQKHPFHPHVTLARGDFDPKEWRRAFTPIPFMLTHLRLYESLGQSNYAPLWTHPLTPPIEDLDHTGDIGFLIRGTSYAQLYLHGAAALAFAFPQILSYLDTTATPNSLHEGIILLNDAVSAADGAIGCPFKAVSFHGEAKQEGTLYQWEMVIDV